MDKDPAIYVRHILEAIGNIEADIAGCDFERFRVDRAHPAACRAKS
jgi:uncharacterized protein with HEPN domain